MSNNQISHKGLPEFDRSFLPQAIFVKLLTLGVADFDVHGLET
tara:strand:- start:374 stop:502 length:129 start_codon:yes stop_codon:yes gene_type:complete